MTAVIECPCGKSKTISDYAARHGQRYCSHECAKRFRVYRKKDETFSERVTVTLTPHQRAELETRADAQDIALVTLGRRYIVDGLKRET